MQHTLTKEKAATGHQKVSTRVPWWRILMQFLLSFIVVVLLLESLFGWAGVGEQELLKIDHELGFKLFANKNITWRKEGFSRVRFNSNGMNDREYSLAKPPNTKRIAVIGDSYVEALQVAREDNFCSKLEALLNQKSNQSHKFEVMNFGNSGHNLSQSYINLKNNVLNFAPDIVILPYRPDSTFLIHPDIKSGFLGARPNFFVDQNGKLIKDRTVQNLWLNSSTAKRMKATEWLRENSRIWGALSTGMESVSTWLASGGLLKNFLSDDTEQSLPSLQAGNKTEDEEASSPEWSKTDEVGEGSIQFTWPIVDAILTDMNKKCRGNSCKLLVMRMPGIKGHISPLETQLLEATSYRNEIFFLDLTDSFHKQFKQGKKLFFVGHFTENGHKIVANQLFHFFIQKHLFDLGKTQHSSGGKQ